MNENKLEEQLTEVLEETTQLDPVTEFYQTVLEAIDSTNGKSPFGDFLLNSIKGGKKTVYSKTVRENRIFDVTFLDILESSYQHILKITKDPKKSIRYEQEVVGVEKAKKVDASTVRHLASHTQYIKSIENDNVIPSKILATFAEEELAIYENRFIKTLMIRLDKFLQVRYDIIKDNLESFQSDRVKITNEFAIHNNKVVVDFDIVIKKDIEESVAKAQAAFDRVTHLKNLYKGLKNSEFMMALKNAKIVNAPIMKTNIILKNTDFKIAYALWIFLDRYDGLGYDVNVKEKNRDVEVKFAEDIDLLMRMAVSTAITNQNLGQLDSDNLNFKEYILKQQKVKKRLEDELSLKPDSYKLEDNVVSEFFLQQVKKHYDASMKNQLKDGKDYNSTLKSVYREMMEIVNQVYPMLFDIVDPENKPALADELKFAKRKSLIIKTVRQLKEADLKKIVKEEERVNKKIADTEAKIELIKIKKLEAIQKEEERKHKLKEQEELKLQQAKVLEEAKQEALKAKEALRVKLVEEKEKARQKALLERKEAQEALAAQRKVESDERKRLALLEQERKQRQKSQELKFKQIQKEFIRRALEREKMRIAKEQALENALIPDFGLSEKTREPKSNNRSKTNRAK